MSQPGAPAGRFPSQIKYIIGNEAAERFSYYGMQAILTIYLVRYMGYSDADGESLYHLFVGAVYLMTFLGGFLADRLWGKYDTIFRLSLVYVAGHAVLAAWETRWGLFCGLSLIALGAGGIKPCVAAHVGDQFSRRNKHLVPKVFSAFYWSINLGSLLATLLTPLTRKHFGPQVAFAIPGVLMALAAYVFWLGRKQYVVVPPSGIVKDTPGWVALHLLRRGTASARERYGDRPVDDTLAVLRVAVLLLPVTLFWTLFLQTGSSWVLLAGDMNLHGYLTPDVLQVFNPALVMAMIPLFAGVIYPGLEKRGISTAYTRRITVGLFLTALSFVIVWALALWVDGGGYPSAYWIIAPYFVLTAGEILVSITGLEFAYTQAPRSVKSTVMAIWYLTIGAGSFLASAVAELELFARTEKFLFWAGAMFVFALVFALMARGYRTVEYIEDDAT